jgi:Bacterial antitoxin of type II TA system, VapB
LTSLSLMHMMTTMRTTITIDDDVLEHARTLAAKLRTPFKTVINEALRFGLDHVERPTEPKPYKTSPHGMGLKSGRNLDNIQELLSQIEGEDAR